MARISEIRVAMKVASRVGILHAFFWFTLFMIACVLLAAGFSARQPATAALDVGISIFRLGIPLLIIFAIQELISREFERRTYLTTFAYPRGRNWWFISRVFATFLIISMVVAVGGWILAEIAGAIGDGYKQGTPPNLGLPYIITLSLLVLDLMVVLAIASVLSVIASSSFLIILGTIGFTLIARSYMPIVALLQDSGYLVENIANPEKYQNSLNLLSFLIPDLDALDVRMITLYGQMSFLPDNLWLHIAQPIVYCVLLLSIAIWKLNRREFN